MSDPGQEKPGFGEQPLLKDLLVKRMAFDRLFLEWKPLYAGYAANRPRTGWPEGIGDEEDMLKNLLALDPERSARG